MRKVERDIGQALQRLFKRRSAGIVPGLAVERELLKRMGDPHQAYGVIHVAGTNGKGSVCAMLSSILKEAGIRTGRYTSPHLVRFHERFWVDGEPIGDKDLAEMIGRVEEASAQMAADGGREATFFECATAMAFEYMRKRGVRVAVVETGLGGRLDATNVVLPLVSVVTRISLEHTAFLGRTVSEIAGEKAGIIKPGRPVVLGPTDEAAARVLRATACKLGSAVVEAGEYVGVTAKSVDLSGQKLVVQSAGTSYGTIRVPLSGVCQAENVATAVAAVEVLRDVCGVDVPEASVKAGLSGVQWLGRCQVLSSEPVVLLDGAHNPGSAQSLRASLDRLMGRRDLALVVGMCADKDARGFLSAFAGRVRKAWIVPISDERNMPSRLLRSEAERLGWDVAELPIAQAVKEAVAWARGVSGCVCITGSLYLAGEVLAMPDFRPAGGPASSDG